MELALYCQLHKDKEKYYNIETSIYITSCNYKIFRCKENTQKYNRIKK